MVTVAGQSRPSLYWPEREEVNTIRDCFDVGGHLTVLSWSRWSGSQQSIQFKIRTRLAFSFYLFLCSPWKKKINKIIFLADWWSSEVGLLWRWTNDLVFSYLPGGSGGGDDGCCTECTKCTAGVCTANNVTLSDRRSSSLHTPQWPESGGSCRVVMTGDDGGDGLTVWWDSCLSWWSLRGAVCSVSADWPPALVTLTCVGQDHGQEKLWEMFSLLDWADILQHRPHSPEPYNKGLGKSIRNIWCMESMWVVSPHWNADNGVDNFEWNGNSPW